MLKLFFPFVSKTKNRFNSIFISFLFSVFLGCLTPETMSAQAIKEFPSAYDSSWESLSKYKAPEWYEDAKLGFWVHWGIYSVPAFSGDHAAEWYGRWMYSLDGQSENNRGLAIHEHHVKTYGEPSVFGYKDFIPAFKAEKFNAKEWANLFAAGGAKFFTMMGVHHDNFAMWDSKLTKWNAKKMGPKRDLVGEIAKAVRAKGLKFGVSNHSGWNYEFFKFNYINHGDAMDTIFQDLYGNPIINGTNAKPSERDLSRWYARTIELCDNYHPDLYYFDWDINHSAFEKLRKSFAAHYYNKGLEWNKGAVNDPRVVLNYKEKAFLPGTAVLDQERSTKKSIPDMVWQTDDCVYAGDNWGYVPGVPIKPPNQIIDELIDIVSKRGVLMLSFAPRPDGTIPEDQINLLKAMGGWLKVCGESIYSTRPWEVFGEGPTFEGVKDATYSSNDIRFTRNKSNTILYATLLDWPTDSNKVQLKSLSGIGSDQIKSISILGSDKKLTWTQDKGGLLIELPVLKPIYNYAYPIKIVFKGVIPTRR